MAFWFFVNVLRYWWVKCYFSSKLETAISPCMIVKWSVNSLQVLSTSKPFKSAHIKTMSFLSVSSLATILLMLHCLGSLGQGCDSCSLRVAPALQCIMGWGVGVCGEIFIEVPQCPDGIGSTGWERWSCGLDVSNILNNKDSSPAGLVEDIQND